MQQMKLTEKEKEALDKIVRAMLDPDVRAALEEGRDTDGSGKN